jgi:subtilisin family serine protease
MRGRRKTKWALRIGATVLVLAAAGGGLLTASPKANSNELKVSHEVLQATANGGTTSFVVYLDDQADVSSAASMTDENARGQYVYDTLRRHAAETQAPIRAKLDAEGVSYKAYWAVNMIVADAGRAVVDDMAARSDVGAIESNAPTEGIDGEDGPETTDEGNAVEATEIGITNTKASSLWLLGFTGQGIVVANQDTGMRWTHAALRTHYRGWGGSVATSDHNYNWWDSIHARITSADGGTSSPAVNPCGYNAPAPCDDQGHGTHTTGTTVGDDAGSGAGTGANQVGVAPGAKWIGCRNMDGGNGRASTYTECFQFFLAPTNLAGQNADPSKRPHVMNNSWGCPLVGELCARNVMQTIVDNSEASGIFVEASAGNDGPNCNTVQDPPGIYASAFSTGAISGTTNALQGFSSRGTVSSDGSFRMKPDLSAPGASVRSSLRNNDTAYGTMSGTSMAGPHVVGVVAVLWSARPALVRDMPRTKYLLTRSANPNVTVATNAAGCGGITTRPNNHFGWGRVDALAAYTLEPSLNQTISFPELAGKTYGDADIALAATASSGRTVTYAATGNCTVIGGSVHITGAGSCTVTASQAGLDAYDIAASAPVPYYPAVSVVRTFAIAKASQTIDFAALANRTFGVDDGDFDVAATASSGLAVAFAAAGPCSVSGVTVHISGVGDCTITASQSGNANYQAAPNVSHTFRTAWVFGGFFQPVDQAAVNVVQAGSAIPVKFTLGGNQGLDITATEYPRSVSVACAAADPTDAIEQTVTAGGSSLSFGSGQYVYVWKTDKAWSGTCRQLVVKLRDNTEHRASFRFK